MVESLVTGLLLAIDIVLLLDKPTFDDHPILVDQPSQYSQVVDLILLMFENNLAIEFDEPEE